MLGIFSCKAVGPATQETQWWILSSKIYVNALIVTGFVLIM